MIPPLWLQCRELTFDLIQGKGWIGQIRVTPTYSLNNCPLFPALSASHNCISGNPVSYSGEQKWKQLPNAYIPWLPPLRYR